MKRIFVLSIILFDTFILIAQNTEINADKTINENVKRSFTNSTGNDRANWSGFGSAFLNLVGTNGTNELVISPTLYTLLNFKKVANKDTLVIDSIYRKQWFARNLQINAGITPNSKNQLHIDAGDIGFKFAILNNKAASQNDYKKLNNLMNIEDSITIILKDSNFTNYLKAKNSQSKDFTDSLMRKLKISRQLAILLIKPYSKDSLNKCLVKILAYKPTLTFSLNHNYDFVRSQSNSLSLSSEFTFFLFKTVPFDLTSAYTCEADTTQKKSSLNRHVWETTLGPNFRIWKWLELKPFVSYINTQGPLYKKESRDQTNANLTARLKINNQFWLPLTINYDTKNAQFFGFLSIQYSLK